MVKPILRRKVLSSLSGPLQSATAETKIPPSQWSYNITQGAASIGYLSWLLINSKLTFVFIVDLSIVNCVELNQQTSCLGHLTISGRWIFNYIVGGSWYKYQYPINYHNFHLPSFATQQRKVPARFQDCSGFSGHAFFCVTSPRPQRLKPNRFAVGNNSFKYWSLYHGFMVTLW